MESAEFLTVGCASHGITTLTPDQRGPGELPRLHPPKEARLRRARLYMKFKNRQSYPMVPEVRAAVPRAVVTREHSRLVHLLPRKLYLDSKGGGVEIIVKGPEPRESRHRIKVQENTNTETRGWKTWWNLSLPVTGCTNVLPGLMEQSYAKSYLLGEGARTPHPIFCIFL